MGALMDGLFAMLAQLAVEVIFRPIAIILWQINKLLIGIGVLVAKITEILMDTVFRTGFELLAGRLRFNLLPFVFTVVVIVLGVTYVMSAFWFRQTNLVDWKKAFAWLLGALIFYTAGVDLFIASDQLRRGLAAIMYETILSTENGEADVPVASEVYGVLALGDVGDFSNTGPMRDYFGPGAANWLQNDVGLDGLDITMAFLLADIDDLWGSDLPDDFDDEFFNVDGGATDIILGAIYGLQRQFFGAFVAVFAIIEQWVFLLIAVAMGVVFFLMLWAILLAFFNPTEYIAKGIARMWFNMMLVSLFASVLQSTALFLLLISVTAANPIIWIAATIISLLIVLFSEQSVRGAVGDMIKSIPQTFQGAIRGGFMMPMGGGGGGGGSMGMNMMSPAAMAQMQRMATPQGRAMMSNMYGGYGGTTGTSNRTQATSGINRLMSRNSKMGPSGRPVMSGNGGRTQAGAGSNDLAVGIGIGMAIAQQQQNALKPSAAFGPQQSSWRYAKPTALSQQESSSKWKTATPSMGRKSFQDQMSPSSSSSPVKGKKSPNQWKQPMFDKGGKPTSGPLAGGHRLDKPRDRLSSIPQRSKTQPPRPSPNTPLMGGHRQANALRKNRPQYTPDDKRSKPNDT